MSFTLLRQLRLKEKNIAQSQTIYREAEITFKVYVICKENC